MSLFGALNTAVSGLSSQSAALADISDNVANSQTTGFKRVDTAFIDYLSTSSIVRNDSGTVVAQPEYINTVQGTISQTDNPLSMAITGQGFFSVSVASGGTPANPTFSPITQYTRAGDFQLNASGYLVNSAGQYLNGWQANSSGALNTNVMTPIQVAQATVKPVPTSQITLAANLPASTAATAPPVSTSVSVYDAQGAAHHVTLSFTSAGANAWSLAVSDDAGNSIGTASVTFDADGTLASVAQGGATQGTPGQMGSISLATVYPAAGGGTQSVNLQLGALGGTAGLTQFTATSLTVRGVTQDGVPPGSFTGLATNATGNVVASFDNGQSLVIAHVPIVTFAAPDALQRQNGASFTATAASGSANINAAGSDGAGGIVTSAVEASNVDISKEFTDLIVAQRAYSANAKIITTTDEMLTTTLDMKR